MASLSERWAARRKPWPGSATWRYLRDERFLPDTIIRTAIRTGPAAGRPSRQHVGRACRRCGRLSPAGRSAVPTGAAFRPAAAKMLVPVRPRSMLRASASPRQRSTPLSLAALERMRERQPLSQHGRRLVAGDGSGGASPRDAR